MGQFSSLTEATEHLYIAAKQMQNALSELVAEDHPDTFGMMMAREALKKVEENPLLGGSETEYKEISDKEPSLEQMQEMVGGTVELLTLADGRQVFCDEDGLSKQLPINGRASIVIGGAIFGRVVVLSGKARWKGAL